MGSTAALISVDEYLNTSYKPDMDFVDGVLVRRNVGTTRHGRLQTILVLYLHQFEESHGIEILVETRLRVDAATSRYRVPDLLAMPVPYQEGKAITEVPVLIIEIKSPEDSFDDIVDRCFDYEKLGVPNILGMDPERRRAWVFQRGKLEFLGESISVNAGRPPLIDVSFTEIFARLDRKP